jgi:hypothetical protein
MPHSDLISPVRNIENGTPGKCAVNHRCKVIEESMFYSGHVPIELLQ